MIVIDNSLCNIDISPRATEQNVHEYVVSLFESGIDIVEIDYKTYQYFKNINTSKRFIMRIENPGDLLYAKVKKFYYIVLPYFLLEIAGKLEGVRFIIEINAEKDNIDQIMEKCRNIAGSNIDAAIRIMKNFDTDSNELSDLMNRYYSEFSIPLDICPLNSDLTGLDCSYQAFAKGVNMLTLGFSASCIFTPYELFVMYFPDTYKIHPQITLIPYLLLCAARYNLITDSDNHGLYNIINILDTYKKPIQIADKPLLSEFPQRRSAKRKNNPFDAFSSAQSSFFSESNLDNNFSACKSLSEIIDSSDLVLYNRFFDKDDFDN